MDISRQERLRQIPQVDRLLSRADVKDGARGLLPYVQTQFAHARLKLIREAIERGGECPSVDEIAKELIGDFNTFLAGGMTHVINATGILLHTNLGRAPLGEEIWVELRQQLSGYSSLEVDLATGGRGSRSRHLENCLERLFSVESALVVNNNASALFLALDVLAKGKNVLLSRGEIVQIGGGFRIHEIMEASGAKLREVGTTNITSALDYASAIDTQTAAILKVHQSCFAITGHTHSPSQQEMFEVAKRAAIPLIVDLGSGALESTPQGDPTVREVLRTGCDLVCFSGDKLLGGSQAGILLGKKELIQRLKSAPLYRALRLGKLDILLLEQVLHAHLTGRATLVSQMIHVSLDVLSTRAQRLASELRVMAAAVEVMHGDSSIGGGSSPAEVLKTVLVVISVPDSELAQRKLLEGSPPVFVRKGD